VAIPPWVGAMSTGDGFGHCWGRNSEFCPLLLKGGGCAVAFLATFDAALYSVVVVVFVFAYLNFHAGGFVLVS